MTFPKSSPWSFLESCVISEVSFAKEPSADAFTFLERKANEYLSGDNTTGKRQAVRFVLRHPGNGVVDYHAKEIPLGKAIFEVASKTGFRLVFKNSDLYIFSP